MWNQMGGRSKKKRKRRATGAMAAGRTKGAMAARRAREQSAEERVEGWIRQGEEETGGEEDEHGRREGTDGLGREREGIWKEVVALACIAQSARQGKLEGLTGGRGSPDESVPVCS